ncbi:TerC family protein [Chengkuizengella sediminis]|uniref:TerC family protein n=1 Tax=Chengkuizengella sediminis TaxID=1885917 RepID=UPI00138A6A1A|nr:TerC family protein [Chengkuizengella sediminis]NDI36399.1 TerC family protein [Chengkuizengella sediminis]
MELFTPDFWTVLLSIIIIDLVLAGDNAIVIGLAARNVPKEYQKKVIIWGTVGAIVIRALGTLLVVWLLKIPGLLLIGGLLLIWIAYKLLTQKKSHDNVKSGTSLWSAIQTIIIADAVMGLDNVLAIAGASHGSFLMVIIGLMISVPFVVWGSTVILKFIERFPVIIYIGSGVLAFTAGKMITDETWFKVFFEENVWIKWAFIAVIVVGVIVAGRMKNKDIGRLTE